ncbi:alpha-xenorhabdolysin family binary toxin subunit B [Pseudomonas sp. 21LCFQ010]|uniref:alpha-xenorhabdolysin family binary toxin subunit B n=1 Tax=Pseudomonas sp. 21LCFQ010 TaxID=2957506 RepID=UPI0020981D3F|nr:alpha-xenorhabdolysin family binary toxin subunit B [Pseudomonas sp. 21LCFQ010]MCO8162198.1 alpha-xenorhabdolysin family binary toxin subunit B [Pseudomonas sp. 21LCFQ010]
MTATHSSVFTAPQPDIMKSAWALIHAQINSLQLDWLPYLQEKLPRLQSTVILADQTFNEYLGKLLALVRNTDLDSIARIKDRVEADISLSAERKAEALARVTERYNTRLAELKATLLTAAQMLERRIDDVEKITLELHDNTLQNSLRQQLDALTKDKSELDKKLMTIAEDRHLLNEMIKTYEQSNLLNNLQALLPTPEELSALTLPNPKIALLQAGLSRLKALLGKIGDSITYQQLLDERDKLTQRHTESLAQFRNIAGQAGALAGKLAQISAVSNLNNARNTWLLEARKAPDSLYAYFETYLSRTAERLPGQADLDSLKHYLASFQGVWRVA